MLRRYLGKRLLLWGEREHALIAYLRGLGAASIWPLQTLVGGATPDIVGGRNLACEGTVAVGTSADGVPGLWAPLVFPGVTSRAQRPGYDAALWALPFTVVCFYRYLYNTDTRICCRSQAAQPEWHWITQATDFVRHRHYDAVGAAFQRDSGQVGTWLWHLGAFVVTSTAGNTQVQAYCDDGNLGVHAGGAAPRNTGTIPFLLGAEFQTAALNTYTGFFNGQLSLAAILPGFTWQLANQQHVFTTLLGGTSAGVRAGYTGIASDSLLFSDTFIDPNGTLLPAHTPTYTRNGNGWVTVLGTLNIQANRANGAVMGGAPARAISVVDTGNADIRITAIVNAAGAAVDYQGIVVRYSAINACWWICLSPALGGSLDIYEYNPGFVLRARTAIPGGLVTGTDYTIQVTASGQTITATLNGGNTATYATATFNQTQTRHGLISRAVGDRFDQCRIEAA